MQSLDVLSRTPDGALSSPAARRNAEPILRVLRAHLPARGRVLEVASGSGEHAAIFASALPDLVWTPSDVNAEARDSIDRWRAAGAASNLKAPLTLDCLRPDAWPEAAFDAIFCANMIHISPAEATNGLMSLAERVLPRPGGLLALYGPFLEAVQPLAASNAAFEASLKARDPAWGLRDRNAVIATAREHGLAFTLRIAMPANNLMLLFRRA